MMVGKEACSETPLDDVDVIEKNKKHKHTKLQEEESIVRIFPLVTEPETGYQTCVRDAHDHALDSVA